MLRSAALRIALAAGVALTAAALATSAATSPAAGSPAASRSVAAASSAHPFSDPVYYPLRAEMWMNCVRTNPRCDHDKGFWSIDEVVPVDHLKVGVYAMGAGIVHVQVAHGPSCPASKTTFGTSVWIDHGAGVVSRYGHFSSLSVHNGQYVAAGQKLGATGTSGKHGNCTNTYVDYEVLHHGIKGPSVQVTQLRACPTGSTRSYVSWPKSLRPGYTAWNKVPMGGNPVKRIPAAGSNCLPTKAPASPNKPSGVSVKRSGSGSLTVHWTKASSTSSIVLQLGAYSHGKAAPLEKQKYIVVSKSATSRKLTGLHNGTKYGVKISFHNSAGYGRPSSTYTGTPKK